MWALVDGPAVCSVLTASVYVICCWGSFSEYETPRAIQHPGVAIWATTGPCTGEKSDFPLVGVMGHFWLYACVLFFGLL